ncbi:MAG: hypothetical protein NZ455_12225 [Bacteroidia bacterium]|nr:hypothetical protein [Bacteroidia bacterium]
MRRVRQQCEAQRSTEAIAQPAARRPEAQARDTPKINKTTYQTEYQTILFLIFFNMRVVPFKINGSV